MVILALMILCHSVSGQFCVIDSTLYTIDPADFTLHRRILPSSVIDISVDANAFVLTDRYLYKVEYPNLTVQDRILLPQRFNHVITNEQYIILIGTNEVILVDKINLAFRSGIGIEQGDYIPIAAFTQRGMSSKHNLFLVANSGERSTIKVFDLKTGTLDKRLNTDRVLFAEFQPHTSTFMLLDRKNTITVYDMNLKPLRRINVPPDPLFFALHENGYVVYCRHGVFLVNSSGSIIDFQPLPLTDHDVSQASMYLAGNGITVLDLYTVRPKAFRTTDKTFTHLYDLNDTRECFGLLLDENSSPFLFNAETMSIQAISKISMVAQVPPRTPKTGHQDSLWYFQLGAFINHDNALDSYAAFKSENLPVFIDTSDMYRIKLGGFHDKETAMSALELTDLTGWFILQRKIQQYGATTFFLGGQLFTMKDGIIERSTP
ncbi:MAG: SPOR domain-containing protein [candidate division WOR-3 bacterium]|nr:MAG: SPOR domain-containing protein [candidate division WOR-3 bacterium]